jgi:hypothetical protein
MNAAVGILLCVLVAAPVMAQNHFVGSGFLFTPAPTPPAATYWRLATQSGDFVELVVPAATHSSSQISHLVTRENANEYDLNFDAWTIAVNDSRYNRSVMSFGGVTKEQPWSNPWSGAFDLERVQLFINDYDGRTNFPTLEGGILDFIPVPEPATIWMVLFGICLAGNARWHSSYQRVAAP